MSGLVASLVLWGLVWLLFTGLVWKNSPCARREFPGGPGRLFVGQAVAYSVWVLPGLANALRSAMGEAFGLSIWSGMLLGVAMTLALWAVLRFAIPYTRHAARDWERWAHPSPG